MDPDGSRWIPLDPKGESPASKDIVKLIPQLLPVPFLNTHIISYYGIMAGLEKTQESCQPWSREKLILF